MKLRIRGNSIRLRLTRTEVARFAENGRVEDAVEFGTGLPAFTYELISRPDGSIGARFDGGRLTVSIPQHEAKSWTDSDMVGLEALQAVDDRRVLRILIEKDFACLSERAGEDDGDAFANPLASAKC